MPTYYVSYDILPQHRDACMTYFGGMTPADDLAELGNVQLLGRWGTIAESKGWCIAQADNSVDLGKWLIRWSTMATIKTEVVLDDNEQRELILGHPAEYKVSYDKIGDEPLEGENLYFIEYKFHPGKNAEGFQAFASMTKEADDADSGNCTSYCRYHIPSLGKGIAVASAPSANALYGWAHHWNAICDVTIHPCLTDASTRSVISSQPGFAEKRAALMQQMGAASKSN